MHFCIIFVLLKTETAERRMLSMRNEIIFSETNDSEDSGIIKKSCRGSCSSTFDNQVLASSHIVNAISFDAEILFGLPRKSMIVLDFSIFLF